MQHLIQEAHQNTRDFLWVQKVSFLAYGPVLLSWRIKIREADERLAQGNVGHESARTVPPNSYYRCHQEMKKES